MNFKFLIFTNSYLIQLIFFKNKTFIEEILIIPSIQKLIQKCESTHKLILKIEIKRCKRK
jgi:hypothetical protein